MTIDTELLERLQRVAQRNRVDVAIDSEQSINTKVEVIRGRLNSAFFKNAEKWMLPKWAISKIWVGGRRQEVSEQLNNDSHRNWVVIGSPGASSFAISDDSGLTTVQHECGSVELWIMNETPEFPALQDNNGSKLNLVSIDDQIYEWKAEKRAIELDRLIYHAEDDNKEYIINEIVLRNVSLEDASFTFFVVLRPFSIRGVEPIETLAFDTSKNSLYANGLLALVADRGPSSIIMDVFDNPDLINAVQSDRSRFDKNFSAARGNGTCILRYSINMQPAGHETLVFASPLFRFGEDEESIRVNLSPRLRDEAVARWFDFSDDSPAGHYPDEEIMKATGQAKASLVIQARNYVSGKTPDDLVRHVNDLTRIHVALSRGVCENTANAFAEDISRKFIDSEMDSSTLASLLWAFSEMRRLHPKLSTSEVVSSFTKKISASVIDVIRTNDQKQLEDAGAESSSEFRPEHSSENSNEARFQNPDDTTASPSTEKILKEPIVPPRLATLDEILNRLWILAAANIIGELTNEPQLIQNYQDELNRACISLIDKPSWSINSISDVDLIFDIVGAFSILKGCYLPHEFIQRIVDDVKENLSFRGLVRYPLSTQKVSSHLRLRLANALLMLGDREEVETSLERLHEYFSDFHHLPDWVNTKTKGGTLGNGCSLIAAADLRLLLRDILVFEKHGNMMVLSGIPEPWFTSTSPMIAKGIPTEGGYVNIETGVSASQHQIEIELSALPEEIEVFLPFHIPLNMVKVFGGTVVGRFEEPSKRVRLIPHSERVTLTFHR